jgi:hypothetical protein
MGEVLKVEKRPLDCYDIHMEKSKYSQSDRFATAGLDVVHETIDGEVVIVNLKNGYYYSADHTGRVIWSMVANGGTYGEILDLLNGNYPEHTDQIRASTDSFIDELLAEKLIIHSQNVSGDSMAQDKSIDRGSDFAPPVLQRHKDMQDLLLVDPIHEVEDAGWPNRTQN